jgi:dTDP-4-dehydrorhamnose reductase
MSAKSPFETLITVYGGSGFLGRNVVRALAKRHYRIRVAVRRPELAGHLQPLGRVGQIHAVQANIRDANSVEAAARGASVLINLVGILGEGGRQTFDAVHRDGAEKIALAASAHGARLIQVSAIGADENSPSHYGRSKAQAETLARAAVPGAIVMRPSIMFGPDVMTFKQLMQYVLKTIERRRMLVPLPFPLARVMAMVLQYAPGAPLTPDQVESLRADNVVSTHAMAQRHTLEGLGIRPESIAAIVPTYLWRFRRTGQFKQQSV